MEYITLSDLKTRGWTAGAIQKYLGEPDKTKRNPMYRAAAPMKLYLMTRVEEMESSDAWKAWYTKTIESRKKKSESIKNAIETKKESMLDQLKNIDIQIDGEILSKSALYEVAVGHYNDLWMYRDKPEKSATINSTTQFLNRISVNMLRHEYTIYEDQLAWLYGKVGKADAYVIVKTKILEKIGQVYPFLSPECQAQIHAL